MCVFQFLFWFSLIYLLVSSYVLYPSYILFICVCFSLRVCLLGWLFVRPFLGSFVGLFVWLFVCLYHYAFIDFPISTCMYCIYTNIHIYIYNYIYLYTPPLSDHKSSQIIVSLPPSCPNPSTSSTQKSVKRNYSPHCPEHPEKTA